MQIKVTQSQFLRAAASPAGFPPEAEPEVAVFGRSNVGKSSLINRLTGRRKLARTSATPGRTQEFNLFQIRMTLEEDEVTRERALLLVDLPGFGYARFAKTKREALSRMIIDYLSARQALKIVLLLNDCRRQPERDELAVRDLAFANDKRLLILMTKFDKLNQSERARRPAEIAAAYGLTAADLIKTGEGLSVEPIWQRLAGLLDEDGA